MHLEILDALGALVDESLLRLERGAGEEPRFGMLETIREYAVEQLAACGETESTRRAHVAYFTALAERAAPELNAGPEHARWIDRLQREQDNLRAALYWCIENGEVEGGLQLGGAVWRYWFLNGSLSEGREWLQAILRLVGDDAPRSALRARALNGAGVLASQQGDHVAARALHEQSLAIGLELGDRTRIASSFHNLGVLALRDSDTAKARHLLERSVIESLAAGDRRRQAISLNVLGGVLVEQGDYDAARARHAESAAVYRELGDKTGMASARSREGLATLIRGDVEAAHALCQEGLQLARQAGNRATIAWSCLDLALVLLHQKDYAHATAMFAESLSLLEHSGDAWNRLPFAMQGLASVAAATGQPERALRLFGAAAAARDGVDRVVSGPGMGLYRVLHERWLTHASSALGEAAAAALAAGRAMSIDQAIAYALDETSPPQ